MCLALPSAMYLSACATVVSEPLCPPLAVYSQDFQNQAADELDALPEGSAVVSLIEDYGQLRDRIRSVCK